MVKVMLVVDDSLVLDRVVVDEMENVEVFEEIVADEVSVAVVLWAQKASWSPVYCRQLSSHMCAALHVVQNVE